MPWEYGPTAAGASSVLMTCLPATRGMTNRLTRMVIGDAVLGGARLMSHRRRRRSSCGQGQPAAYPAAADACTPMTNFPQSTDPKPSQKRSRSRRLCPSLHLTPSPRCCTSTWARVCMAARSIAGAAGLCCVGMAFLARKRAALVVSAATRTIEAAGSPVRTSRPRRSIQKQVWLLRRKKTAEKRVWLTQTKLDYFSLRSMPELSCKRMRLR